MIGPSKFSLWLATLIFVAGTATAFSPPSISRLVHPLRLPRESSPQNPTIPVHPELLATTSRPVARVSMRAENELSSQGRSTLVLERDDERELGLSLIERLEQMEGIWYSDNFYGPHGREWVQVSATLVGAGTSALVAIKVSGDANVPSGHETWRTKGLPDVGGTSVPAEIQVRENVNDPNGFYWIPGSLYLVSEDQIALTAMFGNGVSASGTFHKHKVGEGA